MIFIGIDPGIGGGVAMVTSSGKVQTDPMPASEADLTRWFESLQWASTDIVGVIERVTGYVGGPGNTGSSQFKLGTSYGRCTMALTVYRIPYSEVMPRVWQKAVGIAPRGKSEKPYEFKQRLKRRAQQLFPLVDVTMKTCDALLIAHYCRISHKN